MIKHRKRPIICIMLLVSLFLVIGCENEKKEVEQPVKSDKPDKPDKRKTKQTDQNKAPQDKNKKLDEEEFKNNNGLDIANENIEEQNTISQPKEEKSSLNKVKEKQSKEPIEKKENNTLKNQKVETVKEEESLDTVPPSKITDEELAQYGISREVHYKTFNVYGDENSRQELRNRINEINRQYQIENDKRIRESFQNIESGGQQSQ